MTTRQKVFFGGAVLALLALRQHWFTSSAFSFPADPASGQPVTIVPDGGVSDGGDDFTAWPIDFDRPYWTDPINADPNAIGQEFFT